MVWWMSTQLNNFYTLVNLISDYLIQVSNRSTLESVVNDSGVDLLVLSSERKQSYCSYLPNNRIVIQIWLCIFIHHPIGCVNYQPHLVQSSTRNPLTRSNSLVLFVTSGTSSDNACAAIIVSSGPIV